MVPSITPALLSPLGYFQIPSANLGTAATLATLVADVGGVVPATAQVVMIQAEAQAIRYRDDGVSPTATTGFQLLTSLDPQPFSMKQLGVIKFIQAAAGGILNVAYYG